MLDHRMKVMPSGMLEISDVRISDRGHFRCNVSNEDSNRMSRVAELKINLDTGKHCILNVKHYGTHNDAQQNDNLHNDTQNDNA